MWLYADIRTMADVPRHYGRVAPDRTALIDGSRRVTFRELDEMSTRMANAIIDTGISRPSNVGLYARNRLEYWALSFAAHKAGCSTLPLNWRLAPAEVATIVDDAGCELILAEQALAASLDGLGERCSQWFQCMVFDPDSEKEDDLDRAMATAGTDDPHADTDPDIAAFLMYTSGTTGTPKGVQLTHRCFHHMRLCEHFEPTLQWAEGDVYFMVMPNFHLVGTGIGLQALYNGVTVSMLPALDPAAFCEVVRRDQPSVTILVPTAIQMILDHPEAESTDFTCFRLVMYAGSAITAHLLKRAMKEMTPNMMQFYGATETAGAVTLLRPEQHDLEDESRLKSCGTPLELIEVRIIDEQGNEVPDGEVGEMIVRSPSLTSGYWRQPDKTAEAFRDGWYHTGDAGYRGRGGLLYIVDRVKDMIVSGGENVYSAEVEQALVKHPGVAQCAVIGVPDEKWGEMVTAIVVPGSGEEPSEQSIIKHCREHIAGYKTPKTVYFVEALQVTASGKVQKKALRDSWLEKSA